ncbi:MAG: DctP family TRAP transporter solute-binding subunit [Planctomycetota bacterium]|jgi:tripartite ATP-independent transporter DctP family solute receptor|nr:DctP family TRAP transporter solute-binding subunit [Planctomycetota bacterium]
MKRRGLFWPLAALLLPVAGLAAAAQTELKLAAGSMAASSPVGIAVGELAKRINRYAKGAIRAKPFYEVQLADASGMVEALRGGLVDIGVAGNSYFSSLVPELQAFELPYLFANYLEARKVLDGPAADPVKRKLEENGIKCLAFWEIGFRHLTNNVRPVNSLADVKGLKLRVLPADIQMEAWKSFGAVPVALDSSLLHAALRAGEIEGQENPINEIQSKKLYEVQKYLSLTAHVYTPMILGIALRVWGKLNRTGRETILKAVGEATGLFRQVNDRLERENMDWLRRTKMEINEYPDLALFKKMAEKIHESFIEGKAERKVLLDAIKAAK